MKKIYYLPVLMFCFVITGCNKSTKTSQNTPDQLTPSKPIENFDYLDFSIKQEPMGFNVSYYSDIYSRGFAWFTDDTTTDTKLYLVESGLNYNADFSNASEINGETITVKYSKGGESFEALNDVDNLFEKITKGSSGNTVNLNVHKVHVENLKKNTSYSYKVGSEKGWKYGAFTTEIENPTSITAVQVSDAQSFDPTLLSTFRNTIVQSSATAREDLDFFMYNGDLFDQSMKKVNNETINHILRYTKASDAITDYKSMIPFMASSGNHEPAAPYAQYLGADINYGAFDYKGANYSYDYGPAHFIVLNSNRLSDDDSKDSDYLAQINWLREDLSSDECQNAEWKIVMMHIACYSTGDHSNDEDNQRLVERLSPLFSQYHVDLVLQAHDHTYNKTLPYKWDSRGYSETYNNSNVVEFNAETKEINNRLYDVNPNGTYYVTTGAGGHRVCSYNKDGKHEYEDGIYAEVIVDEQGNINPVDSSKTFRNNKYKCELGKLNYTTTLNPFTTSSGITVSGVYTKGNPATGCVDGQMFGVLNIQDNSLTYDAYVMKLGSSETLLFDTLNIIHE